ncbi:hypothetical protein AVEN_105990-1, partial [Araneus ventricosus]
MRPFFSRTKPRQPSEPPVTLFCGPFHQKGESVVCRGAEGRLTRLLRRPICGLFTQRLSGNGRKESRHLSGAQTKNRASLFTLRLRYG